MTDCLVRAVDSLAAEMVEFAADLINIPTVNPPGDNYQACVNAIGGRLREFGFDIEFVPAEGPRPNVIGTRKGRASNPLLHFNGHIDVVPAGAGWTRNP